MRKSNNRLHKETGLKNIKINTIRFRMRFLKKIFITQLRMILIKVIEIQNFSNMAKRFIQKLIS